MTGIKIVSVFNNIIGIEHYGKKVTLEHVHCPSSEHRIKCFNIPKKNKKLMIIDLILK
jgi:hypothetical protein